MKKIIAFALSVFLISNSIPAFGAMSKNEAKSIDLRTKSEYTSEELAAGLKKELIGYAEDFLAAEEKYGINAVFLAAVSAFESGWGRYCFRENNIFGWSGKSFESKSECIDFVASKLSENYLSEDGKNYHGTDLNAVNKSYNGSDIWLVNVAGIMAKIDQKAEAFGEIKAD